VADIARRDVPTCGLDETVGAVRDRLREGRWDVAVVVDDRRVVLGLVRAEALGVEAGTRVEDAMQSGPVTLRPNLGAGQMPDYSFCCPGCGTRVSPGQALRGGRIVCTTCGETVSLPVREGT
jgi:hypothetical protein